MVAEFITGCARVFASERSVAIFREQLERNPDSRIALLALADIHWRKKDWKEALDYALRALWKSPHNFHMLAIISLCYAQSGDVERAYCYAKCVPSLGRRAGFPYALQSRLFR